LETTTNAKLRFKLSHYFMVYFRTTSTCAYLVSLTSYTICVCVCCYDFCLFIHARLELTFELVGLIDIGYTAYQPTNSKCNACKTRRENRERETYISKSRHSLHHSLRLGFSRKLSPHFLSLAVV